VAPGVIALVLGILLFPGVLMMAADQLDNVQGHVAAMADRTRMQALGVLLDGARRFRITHGRYPSDIATLVRSSRAIPEGTAVARIRTIGRRFCVTVGVDEGGGRAGPPLRADAIELRKDGFGQGPRFCWQD